ncbi:hypothetical protein AGMMS49941_11410 [Deferribacterales bacterium]|nr:hypothetical protein AGMMS49941_11410 [Deferribacterales bacterium]
MPELVDMPNDELITRGNEAMANRKYSRAVIYYKNVILNADNPNNARYAQKSMGDAYFNNKDYTDAIAAYEVYVELYRRTPDTPFVLFQLGMSYRAISLSAPRDQTSTIKASENFDELKMLYPVQYEQYMADRYSSEMRERLAEHEYRVAKYYYNLKHDNSSIMRSSRLIEKYPDFTLTEQTYRILILALARNGEERNVKAAAEYLSYFKRTYPNSKFNKELTRAVEKRLKS